MRYYTYAGAKPASHISRQYFSCVLVIGYRGWFLRNLFTYSISVLVLIISRFSETCICAFVHLRTRIRETQAKYEDGGCRSSWHRRVLLLVS